MKLLSPLLLSFAALLAGETAQADSDNDEQPSVETTENIARQDAPPAKLSIRVKIDDGTWSRKKAFYPLTSQRVRLKVKPVENGKIRWYMIFADLTQNYNNANPPWTENAYSWVGYDEITYLRIELPHLNDKWTVEPFANDFDLFNAAKKWLKDADKDTDSLSFYSNASGTFWFQARVTTGNKTLRSPGIEEVNAKGISKKVLRISRREREGLLGYITSFYNVPGLFGSVLYQSKNHIGADCADVLMAAWSKWRRRPLNRNFNVQAMVGKFKTLAEFEMRNGVPEEPVKWSDISPGDFIAVRYGEGGKKFHHVGALYEDSNKDGLLNGDDLVIHAGPDPLHLSRLEWGPFDGHVVILKSGALR